MAEKTTESLLRETISGNLSAFAELLGRNLEKVDDRHLGLGLTRAGVSVVLRAFQQGSAQAELVQKWASFMRRGYTDRASTPVRPLQIAYEAAAESEIVEVIARLDELGDSVDGRIDESELAEMVNAMK